MQRFSWLEIQRIPNTYLFDTMNVENSPNKIQKGKTVYF